MPTKKTDNQTQKHDAVKQNEQRSACSKRKTDNKTEAACENNCRLNDFDIISDVLGGHKNLVKLYGTALLETDSEKLRKLTNTQMSECAMDQYDAFRYMNDRGMYKVEPAPAQKIKSACDKFGKNVVKFGAGASKIK